ncbi:MAG: hypothetical protein CSA42_08155 [Gammaproteobacteria bacterium]|nr:MAG: hypothetical protein CSA42_08155 [Gammaproteobacteria bacterium]
MNTVSKPFASIILIIAFTVLFGSVLPIKATLYMLSPKIINDYLQVHNYSGDIFKLLISWLMSFVVSIVFVLKSGIVQRLVINWGFKLLTINILLIAGFLVIGLASLIQSSWLILIISVLWAYLNLPIKIMIFIGVLKILLSLSTVDGIEEEKETPQWYFIVLVLGFAIIFVALFGVLYAIPMAIVNLMEMTNLMKIEVNRTIISFLNWIAPVTISFFFVKSIGYLLAHQSILNILGMLHFSSSVMLVTAILKILLTLKAPIK